MKNKKIALLTKVVTAALFAGIFAITGIPGKNMGSSEVQAASNTGTIYYGFNEITDINNMKTSTAYMFLTEHYSNEDAVVAIPSGSARLTLTAVPASDGNSDKAVTTDGGQKATQGNVHVEQSGAGFDGCQNGHIGYLTRQGKTGWYYGCDAGGATNKGPFYAYTYTTKNFSTSDITIEVTDAFDVPTSQRSYTDSNDLTGLKVKITVNEREFNVPYFTVSAEDNSVDPETSDTSVILNIGGVEKEAELKCRQVTPAGQTDYTTGELKNLTPKSDYVITVDGEKITVTADENGNLDLTPYAGKTITIAKKGNGSNVVDSEPQTIEVKKSESAPEEKQFGTKVEGDNTVISGVGADKEYSLDGGKTWTTGNGADIVIPTGTDIQIRTKATTDTPASEIIRLEYKNETPDGTPDYTEGKLTGLKPNEKYILKADGKETEVTADTEGKIDLTPYAGKTIEITKPGNGSNLLESDPQTIEVKKNESAPDATGFETKVDGKDTIVSGITEKQEYSLDGGKTWTTGKGADVVIPTGTDIQIRTKATTDTPASEIIRLEYKNETPDGTPDYTEGKLTGLKPNEKYILKADGKETEVTADTEGKIDLTPYAGKTIEVIKPGNGDNLLDSDAQVIGVKPGAAAPKKDDYKVIVNGAYTNISGITKDQEYSLDGGKTWTPGTGAAIRVKTGKEVLVRVKATKDEPASEIVRVTTIGEKTNLAAGTIQDSKGKPCAGAEIELRNGTTVIAATTTAEDGSFAFVGVPEGTYNFVVKQNGKTETYVVKIADGKVNLEKITVDDGKRNSTVNIAEGTPSTIVGNIQSQFDTIVEDTRKGYTKEDDAIVKSGGSAEINVNVEAVKSDVENTKYMTQVASKDGMKIGNFIDIVVTKIITDMDGKQTKTGLIELPKLLTFYFDIDSTMQGKQSYVVYRYHQDYIDTLTTTPNEDGEYIEISEDGTKLILHAKKFSTYAIGYSDEAKTVDNKSVAVEALIEKANTPIAETTSTATPAPTATPTAAPVAKAAPDTGDNSTAWLFIMMLFAGTGIAVFSRKKKVNR